MDNYDDFQLKFGFSEVETFQVNQFGPISIFYD